MMHGGVIESRWRPDGEDWQAILDLCGLPYISYGFTVLSIEKANEYTVVSTSINDLPHTN